MATKKREEEIRKKLGLEDPKDVFQPKPQISPAPAPSGATKPSGEVEVFRNEQGRLSGVTLPDGRTLLGLSPEEVRSISQKFAKEVETPVGAVEVAQQREAEMRQQIGGELAQQVGQLPPDVLADVAAGRIDIKQAISAGVTGAAPGVIGGAVVGAAVGGLGAVPGAVIGGVGGFLTGVITNVRSQFRGEISAATVEYRRIEQNLRAIVTDTNRNPQNAGQNLELFNYQMALMQRSYQETKLNDNAARKVGKDATTELVRFEIFYTPGGAEEFLTREMQLALLNPDPNRPSLITFEEAYEGNE